MRKTYGFPAHVGSFQRNPLENLTNRTFCTEKTHFRNHRKLAISSWPLPCVAVLIGEQDFATRGGPHINVCRARAKSSNATRRQYIIYNLFGTFCFYVKQICFGRPFFFAFAPMRRNPILFLDSSRFSWARPGRARERAQS